MGQFFNQESQTSVRRMLRNRMTHAEKMLWYYLRGKGIGGYKFRRQHGIGQYVVDFYCPSAKLVVEIDGDSHFRDDTRAHDIKRQKFIEMQGIRVLRFTDNDVRENVVEVVNKIVQNLHHP